MSLARILSHAPPPSKRLRYSLPCRHFSTPNQYARVRNVSGVQQQVAAKASPRKVKCARRKRTLICARAALGRGVGARQAGLGDTHRRLSRSLGNSRRGTECQARAPGPATPVTWKHAQGPQGSPRCLSGDHHRPVSPLGPGACSHCPDTIPTSRHLSLNTNREMSMHIL